MTEEKILEVCNLYSEKLGVNENWNPEEANKNHIMIMLKKIPEFIEQKRIEKAMRWLGFIQGYLWQTGMYTIDDLKKHNK